MGFEFDESEMYPCDICGEFWPMGEMHELEDGRIVYRNGKKVLILAGKAAPKVLIEDRLADLIGAQTKQGISLDDVIPQNVVCGQRRTLEWTDYVSANKKTGYISSVM